MGCLMGRLMGRLMGGLMGCLWVTQTLGTWKRGLAESFPDQLVAVSHTMEAETSETAQQPSA